MGVQIKIVQHRHQAEIGTTEDYVIVTLSPGGHVIFRDGADGTFLGQILAQESQTSWVPEVDLLIRRVNELQRQVDDLNQWKDEQEAHQGIDEPDTPQERRLARQ